MKPITFFSPRWASLNTMGDRVRHVQNLKEADFLLLTGGEDISPFLYSEEVGESRGMNYSRDVEDAAATIEARIFNIPVFGICRGAQLLHVLNGGTLIKHLAGHTGQQHKVVRANGTAIDFMVNSVHHQAIPPAEAVAMYGEGNVILSEDKFATEAFFDEKRNVGGVQYHPEFSSCPKAAIDFAFEIIEAMV